LGAYLFEALERRLQLSASLSLSGTQTITPGSVVNASADSSAWQSEMSVAVDTTNPLRVAAFSHRAQTNYDFNRIDVFYSTDGGANWTVNAIDGNDDGLGTGSRGDPTITFDAEGRLYICYGFLGGTGMTLMCAVDAQHGGASFDQFTVVDSGLGSELDKWIMTSGPDPTTGDPAVYIAYTKRATNNDRVVVAGSNDGGDTFTSPAVISDDHFNAGLFACPAVTAEGALYVSWHDGNDIFVD
jgi:hypothetical protein